MPGSKSDYLENKILDHVLGGGDYTRPATVYVGLFTTAPSDTGGGTEVSGGSYARVAVTNNATNFPAASSGSKSNGTAITFPAATANWGTVVAFGIFDASSGGNLLYWGWLGSDSGKVFTAGTDDNVTIPGNGLIVDDQVRVLAIPGATLPTGLSEGTTYFVKTSSGNVVTLSATQGGATLDITAAGAGLIAKIQAQTINSGGQPSFAASTLVITED